jgi:glycosyltransferase involved in cell wall biosynthesis
VSGGTRDSDRPKRASEARARSAVLAEQPGDGGTREPAISVIVCSYNSRRKIDHSLSSLRDQEFDEPYEVIVVDSGTDDAAEYVRKAYPEVRVVRSEERLWPGLARNAGVRVARGEIIAFLPDDGVARRDWLRRRVAKHREGYEAVGGAITNGTPWHPVGSAGYYLEYSALIPAEDVLGEQAIPHCLSYDRSLFERLGSFPEEAETGEDTLFNERLAAAGVEVGFDASVQLDHLNLRHLGPYLEHQYDHGRGLAQCVEEYGFSSPIGPAEQRLPLALWRMFASYPARRWWHALQRIWRGRKRWALAYLFVTPLVWAGLWATSVGAWREWRKLRAGGSS